MVSAFASRVAAFFLRPFAAWERFLFEECDALPLAVLRIALGAYLLFYFAALYPLIELHFFPPALLGAQDWAGFPAPLLIRYVGSGLAPRLALYGLTLLACVALMLGVQTRLAASLLWLLDRSWLSFNAGHNSGDNVLLISTFLMAVAALFGHPQRVLSLDAWFRTRETGRSPRPRVPAWPLRSFQVQLVLIYFFTGVHKLSNPDWYNGEALFYVFQQPVWSRFDLTWLTGPVPIASITYGTLLFEVLLFPALVWVPAARAYVLLAGVLFHLGILLTMRVFVFSEAMVLSYLCFVNSRPALVSIARSVLRRMPRHRIARERARRA
ncbi:MAG TPA: HTTM domain-containing protein [Polyangiaceae bacterium]|nr:HTTM domain-containing protein [Polyangiaceae bacterium]